MKVGYIQNAPRFGAVDQNLAATRALIGTSQADLLVLPELFATGYIFTSRDEVQMMAETPEGKTAQWLKELSLATGAVMVGGFVERDEDRFYNSALIAAEGQVVDTYRKIHLFNKEHLWFTPGDKALKVHELKGCKIGVMICFDRLFPEVCRTLALKGAQVVVHPSNLVMPHTKSIMVTRCLENRIFTITSNRIGTESRGDDSLTFTGESQITAPDGQILALAPKTATHAGIVEINPGMADNKQVNAFNNLLADRRTDLYDR